jgi:hypothetical protein
MSRLPDARLSTIGDRALVLARGRRDCRRMGTRARASGEIGGWVRRSAAGTVTRTGALEVLVPAPLDLIGLVSKQDVEARQ